jgi:acyl-CoA reductase-like NAD-dependent aldehyde dehydrogenase
MREAVSFAGRTMVRREPVGVAAVIASWSYPLILAFCQLAPALAAGCTIVLKPAAETSLSAYILAEAFEAADFPPGVFNLVTGTGQVAEMLAAHPGVDIVAVAGPTPAGRRIAAICGEALKPVSLELGGKSAAIVLDDVDLAAAAAELGCLCFANSGQACFTMSRVLAPRSRYDEAVSALVSQAAGFAVGDPMAEETTMGPLASPRQRVLVESCVTAGVTEGARIVAGGRRPATPVRGYYYEPTVFADADAGMAIARDEIWGPVVAVIPYESEAEAIAIANDSRYGLAGSVWTDDQERGLEVARRARVGTFGVNLYVPDIGAPWGGRKASGMGSVYGPEGLQTYLATKCVFLPTG